MKEISQDIKNVVNVAELRSILNSVRADGRSIGFVPTMGALHDGHGSLITAAAASNDVVVVSIFVNPLQFAEGEDFGRYPRTEAEDKRLAASFGADIVFFPTVEEMYPWGEPETSVDVGALGTVLDGESRPGHFQGVAFVVTKLLSIVRPSRAYFGEKDFQQLAIIRQITEDFSLGCEIVGCPIVRETDGLALSSRNRYLSDSERTSALRLSEALAEGRSRFLELGGDHSDIEAAMLKVLNADSSIAVDYAVAVDGDTLRPKIPLTAPFQLLVAARVGSTRLIDNRAVQLD